MPRHRACLQNFECATGFEEEFEQTPACGTGVATHVFQPEETGIFRYGRLRTTTVLWDIDLLQSTVVQYK